MTGQLSVWIFFMSGAIAGFGAADRVGSPQVLTSDSPIHCAIGSDRGATSISLFRPSQ
jgi:uncharacterized membrane protein YoaK (UPF0700 family)